LDFLLAGELMGRRVVLLQGVLLGRFGSELVADLRLVAILVLPRPAAEEDSAVEVLSFFDSV
jgi:hypothetical protein